MKNNISLFSAIAFMFLLQCSNKTSTNPGNPLQPQSNSSSSLCFSLDSNTISYWRFDSTSQLSFDFSSRHNDLTLHNVARADSGASFSDIGTTYAFSSSLDSFLSPKAITLETRLKITQFPNNGDATSILGYCAWNSAIETFGYELMIIGGNDGGFLSFYLGRATNTRINIEYGTSLILNQWYTIAAQYDGNFILLFIDGVEVAKQAFNEPLSLNNSSFYIGKRGPGTPDYPFSGLINQIAISKIARY